MVVEPTSLTVMELARGYRAGTFDPIGVTDAYLAAIAADPGSDKIYRVVSESRARRQAARAAGMFRAGVDTGPLQGVPIAIKDLVDTEGEVSTAGSVALADRPVAATDAPVAARLDAAGAVFLGRTTMTELAFSGIGINPHFGTPGCARDPDRIPGGSSSGSGVAVARALAAAAIGSDTGGSVRIPASVNGIVGLKTTDGVIPTDGCVALSTTLDTLGPMARTTEDAWALFQAMAARPYEPLAPAPVKLNLIAPTTVLHEGLAPEVRDAFDDALQRLRTRGADVTERPLAILGEARALAPRFGSFAGHEAYALYEELLRSRRDAMDPRVVARILEYADRPSSDYIRLGYARKELRHRFWSELSGVDAVVAPTIPFLPPRIDDLAADEAYVEANAAILRNPSLFNLLGCPAVSVPAGDTSGGLSIGFMIATRPGEESLALQIAGMLEPENG